MNDIYKGSQLKIHDVEQGSNEWHAKRRGLITASEMKLVITPGTLKEARDDKSRTHIFELAAQRITRHVEPSYVSDDMLRGHIDEVRAKALYSETFEQVEEVGFTTRAWGDGFILGFSPDGLVGKDGIVECKSRRQKYQVQTAVEGAAPKEYMLQIQTGLLVTGRRWCDFLSYCGGLPMVRYRVDRDDELCELILDRARGFEQRIHDVMGDFAGAVNYNKWPATERQGEEGMDFDDE